jgi:hypothetical protein
MRSLTNEADKKAEFQAENAREMALSDQKETEFRNRFRSDAIILREEFRSRLKTLPPQTERFAGAPKKSPDTQIFDKPFLTGPSPLSGGADLLEYWAKQLP